MDVRVVFQLPASDPSDDDDLAIDDDDPIASLRRTGSGEMAIDEALLHEAIERERDQAFATLRWYLWQQPTLSLGYFQSIDDRNQHAASASLPVVRRSSGGGAIVHHCELTYCWVERTRQASDAASRYDFFHQAVVDYLAQGGVDGRRVGKSMLFQGGNPFLCFQRRAPEDITVAGYKVLGSAQRRHQGVLLQHGSLLLAASPFAPQLPGLTELSGRDWWSDGLRPMEIALELTALLGRQAGWQIVAMNQVPSGEVARRAHQWQEAKFSTLEWTARR
jgi:lipoate-protein ligase A